MPNHTTLLARRGLDLDVAVLLAQAALKAYESSVMIEAWAEDNGFGMHCTTFDHDNIQGFWCATDDVVLLSFRGTSNPGQWIRDFRIAPVDYAWGRVHAGFRGGLELAERDLIGFQAAAEKAKHVWVTGHSLGGALAVMAASWLKIKGITSSLYTYGQPRVGLGGFAERFEAELPGGLIRFVNQSDIVPRVPPGLIYRHTGIVKHIVPGALEGVGDELVDEELPALTEEEFAALQAQLNEPADESLEGVFSLFSDHSCSEYVRLLTEIRDA